MWAVATVALFAFGLLLLVWAGQRRVIYFPDGQVPPASAVGLPDAAQVTLATDDGVALAGWFVAAPRAVFTIVVFNGNAGNRAYRAPLAIALRNRGFNVLLFDYRGYGGNAGAPTERGLTADARAARAHVMRTAGVDAQRLVYLGESLGAAVAVGLAATNPPAALILRSPFTSLRDIGRYHYPLLPVGLLLRDRFDAMTAIEAVRAPTLVIAGDRDGIVPLEQSRRLFDQIPDRRKRLLVVAGAGHNDAALLNGGEMLDAIDAFLAEVSAFNVAKR
jgi:hypothetical protein